MSDHELIALAYVLIHGILWQRIETQQRLNGAKYPKTVAFFAALLVIAVYAAAYLIVQKVLP